MNRNEWIAVLKKAKELTEGKDATCFKMFDYLLEAMNTAPRLYYRCDEEWTEEEEEEDDE